MKDTGQPYRIVLLMAATLAVPVAAGDAVHDTPEHVVGENPYPFDTVDHRVPEKDPVKLPDSVAPKLTLLTEAEIAFLESGDARALAGSLEDTVEALEEHFEKNGLTGFAEAYDGLLNNCNACHMASGYPIVKIVPPTEAPQGQDFTPRTP